MDYYFSFRSKKDPMVVPLSQYRFETRKAAEEALADSPQDFQDEHEIVEVGSKKAEQ